VLEGALEQVPEGLREGVFRVLAGAALPPVLQELPKPPVRLFAYGSLPRGPCVAVVGAREATAEALVFARQFAFDLARHGVAVASGGAKGIDAAAHRGALDAGGVTLVVAPSGLTHPYPEEHAELFAEIVAKRGCHLSPFAMEVKPRQHQFFLRNAVLVALSHALVVVEAGLRSGARNAARWARELGRPCFVVPSAPWNVRGLGGLQELEWGAQPIASIEPVLRSLEQRRLHGIALEGVAPPARAEALLAPEAPAEAVGTSPPLRPEAVRTSPPLPKPRSRAVAANEIEQAILETIDAGVRYPAEIALALSLGAGEVSHALLLLTLRGLVQNQAGVLSRVQR
jgi:DNA processing protein